MEHHGGLQRSTALLMWTAYGAQVAATARALAKPDERLPVPRRLAPFGWLAAAAGVGLCVAGMSRFAGVREVEGTRHEALTTAGVYRWSRNPQYLGYLVGLAGASVARRSLAAAAVTGAVGVVYAQWLPLEEEQLVREYGADYEDYRGRTSRWWGTA